MAVDSWDTLYIMFSYPSSARHSPWRWQLQCLPKRWKTFNVQRGLFPKAEVIHPYSRVVVKKLVKFPDLWNPKVHHNVQKSSSLYPILKHMSLAAPTHHFLYVYFNSTFHLRLGLLSGLFPRFSQWNCMRTIWTTNFILHNLIYITKLLIM
jgi:hypothetical protein